MSYSSNRLAWLLHAKTSDTITQQQWRKYNSDFSYCPTHKTLNVLMVNAKAVADPGAASSSRSDLQPCENCPHRRDTQWPSGELGMERTRRVWKELNENEKVDVNRIRIAWIAYDTAAWNLAQTVRESVKQGQFKALPPELVQYEKDWRKRTNLYSNKTFCERHQEVGDLYPITDPSRYNKECGICKPQVIAEASKPTRTHPAKLHEL